MSSSAATGDAFSLSSSSSSSIRSLFSHNSITGSTGSSASSRTGRRDMDGLLEWAVQKHGVKMHPQLRLQREYGNKDDDTNWGWKLQIREERGGDVCRTTNTGKLTLPEPGTVLLQIPKQLSWTMETTSMDDEPTLSSLSSSHHDNSMMMTSTMNNMNNIPPGLDESLSKLRKSTKYSEFQAEFAFFVKLLWLTTSMMPAGESENDNKKEEENVTDIVVDWHPWIEALPTPDDFTTGLTFSDAEISCLPLYSQALVAFEKSKFQLFCTLLPPSVAKQAEKQSFNDNDDNEISDNDDDDDDEPFSSLQKQQYMMWSYNVVMTRCWKRRREEQQHGNNNDSTTTTTITDLVPMGDLFNHGYPANVFVDYESSDDTINFIYQGGPTNSSSDYYDYDNNDNNNSYNGTIYQDLSISYGGCTNPHRFLVIFGFVDTSMEEVWSQLVFASESSSSSSEEDNNDDDNDDNDDATAPPRDRFQHLGGHDKSKMVIRACDGAVSNTVWDCILYKVLEARGLEQEQNMLYDAHIHHDDDTKQQLHRKYAPQTTAILYEHVENVLKELDMLSERIEETLLLEVHNNNNSRHHATLIRAQNDFLTTVFGRVRDGLMTTTMMTTTPDVHHPS